MLQSMGSKRVGHDRAATVATVSDTLGQIKGRALRPRG